MVPPVPMQGYVKTGATVLYQVQSDNTQLAQWMVECACGSNFICRGADIRRRKTLKCNDCLRVSLSEMAKDHGESRGYLYNTWVGMRYRCRNPKYRKFYNYGGRGINMCEEWAESYPTFAKYVRKTIGERPSPYHSIDRIDNDGNYEPGNIRWVTATQQMLNRRPRGSYEQMSSANYSPKISRGFKSKTTNPLEALHFHLDDMLGF